MNKEMKKLLARLEDQGFEALIRKSGHIVIMLDGARITTLAGTPSDHRSWKNSMSYLKRAGYKP